MRLTVIGASGSYPGPDSPASCYLLESDFEGRNYRMLIDMGSGALGVLHQYIDPTTVEAVVLSHLHADHCLDLTGFYVLRRYHPNGHCPKIPVWGPEDTDRRMAKAYDLDEDPGMNEEFDFIVYPDAPFTVGPFTITARRVAHPVTAYGLRIEADGKVLAYSGDTGTCDALVETARDADFFLCEASFLEGADNPPDLHLTGAEAGTMASQAGAKRLVITHVPPWHDCAVMLEESHLTWDGPVELAVPGKTYDI
ncbi:MBL fold metallo-hydrolase [Nocardioides marmorisolisilvae]|uniref:MBL fold metallo-hydrolase n=1 Tax=Nocardioides marmorisolisilvae TaxID=1542737 RepID=A0A3N0DSW2_9ACTN|nr:MBL fold metallo-hydrolase [Nocardioides marmorisolisilvae]RNL78727.1 MBL fold metallo-hydrolase [Nocardioides marmorisolisilvae]